MTASQLTSRHRKYSKKHLHNTNDTKSVSTSDLLDKKSRSSRRYHHFLWTWTNLMTRCSLGASLLSLLLAYAAFVSLTSSYSDSRTSSNTIKNELLSFPTRLRKTYLSSEQGFVSTATLLSHQQQQQQQQQQHNPLSFGFVMRDFARRVLSRHIVNSNILVVASDATTAAKNAAARHHLNNDDIQENPYDSVDFKSPYSMGGTFALHAIAEGHAIHAMDYQPQQQPQQPDTINSNSNSNRIINIDDWWLSFDNKKVVDEDYQKEHWWSSNSRDPQLTQQQQRPNWILTAVFDLGFGDQDPLWERSSHFLAESTVTYIITTMHSQLLPDNSLNVDGLVAAEAMLGRRYKLQVLSVSHYHTDDKHVQKNKDTTFDRYGPNGLLPSVEAMKEFLLWGAEAAVSYGGRLSDGSGTPFTAYILATQGLDLAIPSLRVYLSEGSRVYGDESKTQINLYKPLQFKPCRQAQLPQQIETTFDTWKGEPIVRVSLPASNNRTQFRMYHRKAPTNLGFSYVARSKKEMKERDGDDPKPEDATLWLNHPNGIASSEAACVRMGNLSRCTTRVVAEEDNTMTTKNSENDKRPNILLLLLDPISRGMFERSMPLTRQTLRDLGFVQFSNYTVVGGNSGPNQAALYSGIPLTHRDGIRKDAERIWLWDRLRDAGYKTLKAEDGCIENSNMVQSLKPNTTHGEALNKLFCFDFDRPNCIGPDLASSHLLQYGEQFVKAYNGVAPWAGFMHFVDTHEDTMVLSALLDSQISDFFERLNREKAFENTVVVLCSDHGLHYGPYFQAHGGRKERSQPILFMRTPSSLQSQLDTVAFKKNAGLWTTAFDLHETILLLTDTSKEQGAKNANLRKGISLFDPLPSERKTCRGTSEIPEEYCALYDPIPADAQCKRLPPTPSVLSFFADIPLENRPKFNETCGGLAKSPPSTPSFLQECQCATSHRSWYACTGHPWGFSGVNSLSYPEEHFALMKCRGHKLSIDTRVLNQPSLSTRAFRKLESTLKRKVSPPNVMMVEIDSASVDYADRHFPLTRKFLKEHRLNKDDSADDIQCNGDICAADFTLFGLVGPNSIANQIPALSGCQVSRFHESCIESGAIHSFDFCWEGGMFQLVDGSCERCPKGSFLKDPLSSCIGDASSCCTAEFSGMNSTRICRDEKRLEHNLQLFRRGPRRHNTWCPVGNSSPFIFDVAKDHGYITFFGEEICYEDSMFVPQDNVFPLKTDLELLNVYCRAQEKLSGQVWGERVNACAAQQTLSGKTINPGFDHIAGMWDAYPNVPKFAFMNVVAAHDYSAPWIKMIQDSESYDAQLVAFLMFMTSREDFSNTAIILRADHGLQGGPATLDYSLQVEHRDPWTQIIVPKNLQGVSLESLFANQNKLATGFDLYRTLRELMAFGKDESSAQSSSEAAIPEWSFNLLKTVVPDDRTCTDAKIPVDFCPCEGQGPDRPPNFGVCNPFDPYGDLFCVGDEENILPEVLEV